MIAPDRSSAAAGEGESAKVIAAVIAAIGTAQFGPRLTGFLRQQAPSDSMVLLAYHRSYPPQVLFDDLDPRDQQALYGRYFEGAYLLSPFYLRWQAAPAHSALYRLEEIVPDGFFESVYYTDYYARSGLVDELAYVVPTGTDIAMLISLGRTSQLSAYSDNERRRLVAIEPIVSSAAKRHTEVAASPRTERLKTRLADAMALFGSDILTERERGVVQLMLRGHSSKSCARELGISPTTERVHRRNIYGKLDISSQAELFKLFFDALAADDLPPETDPLTHRRHDAR